MTEQKKKIKVLFLDIDGVLNSTRTAVGCGQGFPHSLTELGKFDPVALALIRNLCGVADISIVLSSTWRKLFAYHDVANALDLPIMGATDMDGKLRGEEIQRWLDAHTDEVESYAIVDDDSDMLSSQHKRFVKTDGHDGLMWRDYVKLCRLFGVDPINVKPARDAIQEGT